MDLEERIASLEARVAAIERRVNTLALRLTDTERYTDTRIDILRSEQLEPEQRDKLIAVLYNLATRVEALEAAPARE